MMTLRILAVFLFGITCPLISSQTLPDIYDQLFDPTTQELKLDANAFPPMGKVAGLLKLISNVIQPVVKNAGWFFVIKIILILFGSSNISVCLECTRHFLTLPPYFECTGNFTTVLQTEMEANVTVVLLSKENFGLMIEASSYTKVGSLKELIPIQNTPELEWIESISFAGQGKLSIRAGSENFQYGAGREKREAVREISVIGTGIAVRESFFGLSRLLPSLPTAKINLKLSLPFESNSYGFNTDGLTGSMNTSILVPFGNDDGVDNAFGVISLAQIKLKGMKPDITLGAQTAVELPGQSRSLLFTLNGEWNNPGQQNIEFNGELIGDWKVPVQQYQAWWTFDQAKAQMIVSLSSGVSVPSFTIVGESVIKMDKVVLKPSFEARFEDNFNLFYLETKIDWDVLQKNDHRVVANFMKLLAPKQTFKEHDLMALDKAQGSIIITNMPGAKSVDGYVVQKGVNFFLSIDAVSDKEIAELLQPIVYQNEGNINLKDVVLVVQIDYLTWKSGYIGFNADEIQIAALNTILFHDAKLSLVNAPASVAMQSKLTWKPYEHAHSSMNAVLPMGDDEYSVEFSVSGEWTKKKENQVVTIQGKIESPWENPWEFDWLTIQSANCDIELENGILKSIGLQTQARIDFASDPSGLYGLDIQVFPDELDPVQHVFFQIEMKAQDLSSLAQHVLRSLRKHTRQGDVELDPILRDIRFRNDDLKLTVSTKETSQYAIGITLNAHVMIHDESLLFKRLMALYQVDYGHDIDFTMEMYIPFDFSKSDLYVKLQSPSVNVLPNLDLTEINVKLGYVKTRFPPSIHVSTTALVTFDHQPEAIRFVLEGELQGASLRLAGLMSGTWLNAFNLPGLDTSHAALQMKLIPSTQPLKEFVISTRAHLGQSEIQMKGFVDLYNPKNVFFYGLVKQLSVRDIFRTYNQVKQEEQMLRQAEGKLEDNFVSMDVTVIPKDLVVEEMAVKFAPKDFKMKIGGESIVFTRGFEVLGNLRLFLGLKNTLIHVRTEYDDEGFNFLADIDLNLPTITSSWQRFLGVIFPQKQLSPPTSLLQLEDPEAREKALRDYLRDLSGWIPQLTQLSLKNLNFRHLAQKQVDIGLGVSVIFQGQEYTFGTTIKWGKVMKPISFIYTDHLIQWKQELLAKKYPNAQCMVNAECPAQQKCFHTQGRPSSVYPSRRDRQRRVNMSMEHVDGDVRDKTCVTECGHGIGELPHFGCSSCITGSECPGELCCSADRKCVAPESSGLLRLGLRDQLLKC